MTKRVWDDFITDQDREVYGSGAFGGKVGVGARPAVVVVDVLNKSIGDESLPILKAMQRFGKSCCGEYGWRAVPHIQDVVSAARENGHPIVFTMPQPPESRPERTLQRFDEKMPGWMDYKGKRAGYEFADEIKPRPGDIVILKPTASSFYRTDLEEQLRARGIDTLIVTGGSTSGCVRATVVDAHARGFKINIPEEAVFDRGEAAHALSLFDMAQKYADVVPSREVRDRLSGIKATPAG